jgi:hypothetical protein
MILYHGSYTAVEKPALSFSRKRTDFGEGFYITPFRAQSVSWAQRFIDKRGAGVITSYTFLTRADEKLPGNINVLEFDSHSCEWLDFITACRLGKPGDSKWDLVIGGVANDKVFDTLQLYFDNLITTEAAIERLRYNKPNFQYCFKKQELIDKYLTFVSAEAIK